MLRILAVLRGAEMLLLRCVLCMCSRAITQIHIHRRNRHGSWRDGKGGALDARTLSESEVEGGADVAAPSESSKATPNHRGAIHCCATVRIAGGRQHRRRQRRQRDPTPARLPRLMTAHAPKPCTRRISHTPHINHAPRRIAPNAYRPAKPSDHRGPSLRLLTAQQARCRLSTGAS